MATVRPTRLIVIDNSGHSTSQTYEVCILSTDTRTSISGHSLDIMNFMAKVIAMPMVTGVHFFISLARDAYDYSKPSNASIECKSFDTHSDLRVTREIKTCTQ